MEGAVALRLVSQTVVYGRYGSLRSPRLLYALSSLVAVKRDHPNKHGEPLCGIYNLLWSVDSVFNVKRGGRLGLQEICR